MRQKWKEVGLGFVTLAAIVAIIVLLQPALRKLYTAGGPILALLCLVTYLAGARWIERRQPTEFAPNRALPELLAGLLLGFLIFSVVMVILFALGVFHPAGWGSSRGLAAGLLFALMAGVMEELLFRGLLFRLSAKVVGTWGALLFTSALFGVAHAANPGATVNSSLAIALEAGILLGAAYAATQRLWLPIGLHIGWNFTEGSIFGMSVSGNDMQDSLLHGSVSGPNALTGGAFGPEASVVAVLVCLLVSVFFLWRTVRLHRVEPLPFGKRTRTSQPATISS